MSGISQYNTAAYAQVSARELFSGCWVRARFFGPEPCWRLSQSRIDTEPGDDSGGPF